MNHLSTIINNYNLDCHKQYTNVSRYLGGELDKSLKDIERFYYSEFWENRYKKRLKEEGLDYSPIELSIIQGVTSILREDTKFKLYEESSAENGRSNYKTMIALNINLDKDEMNDSHINNVIMHEFGHRLYNLPEFALIRYLNKLIIKTPSLYIRSNQVLTEKDYPYFTDDNELRLRIIPIIKNMYDNNWTAEEAYNLSEYDDIKDIFDKEYILHLLENIL